MATFIKIQLQPNHVTTPKGTNKGPARRLTGGTLTFEIEADMTWRLVKPIPADWMYYVASATGTWKPDVAGYTHLRNLDGSHVCELRGEKEVGGWAYYGDDVRRPNQYAVKTTWRRCGRPVGEKSGCWTGVALKGTAGAGLGQELVLAGVRSWDAPVGAVLGLQSSRLGAYMDASAGFGLAIVTGVTDIGRVNGMSLKGSDWTFSLGTKLKGLDTLGKTGQALAHLADKVNDLDGLIRMLKDNKNAKELVNIGKGAYQALGLDCNEPSINILDIPLASAGVALGYYWYWGTAKVLKNW